MRIQVCSGVRISICIRFANSIRETAIKGYGQGEV